ncbi:conserved hypothetical protein, partial [Ricinus communis]
MEEFAMKLALAGTGLIVLAALAVAQERVAAPTSPPGSEKAASTKVLETGARLLQRNSPVGGFDIYLVGFHPMKDHPDQQMEAHHYCHQVNEDFAQCILFDGNTRTANMNGTEYIISEKLFNTLPPEERPFWHPHNGEILSGQLMAPGIPDVAEHALMKTKMNSYGKTWHVWDTERNNLPLGPAMLAWSFNRDGEAAPGLVEQRDRKMERDTAKTRAARRDLQPLAHPQSGV